MQRSEDGSRMKDDKLYFKVPVFGIFWFSVILQLILCVLKWTGALKDWPISAVMWPICLSVALHAYFIIRGIISHRKKNGQP